MVGRRTTPPPQVVIDCSQDLSLLKSIEMEEESGNVRITLVPSTLFRVEDDPQEEEQKEAKEEDVYESIELDADSVLDAFTLFGCMGCQEFFPKSALKKETSVPEDRSVSFGAVTIDEYRMTLGDHPSATSGPPMALDWDCRVQSRVIPTLDEYEQGRCPRRRRRQLKIPYQTRRAVLEKQAGFTSDEVNEAWAQALMIRKQRQETLQRGLLLQYADDFSESASRKFRRLADSMGRVVGIN